MREHTAQICENNALEQTRLLIALVRDLLMKSWIIGFFGFAASLYALGSLDLNIYAGVRSS
jgi:hypothetical protein